MLDSHLHLRLRPLLNAVAGAPGRPGTSPDGLMSLGFATGVLALPFLALGWYSVASAAVLFDRLLDGLDGTLARRHGFTDAEGLLDIALDFLFYALVPFGFIPADPLNNVPTETWLSFALIGTGSSLLAFAVLAARCQTASPGYVHKSLYYPEGLTEETETTLLFVLRCLLLTHFARLAWLFGALYWLATVTRIYSGHQTLKQMV